MDMESSLFCQLLKWLWKNNEHLEREGFLSKKARAIHSRIANAFLRIENDRALDKLLSTDNCPRINFGKQFLYLEPVGKGGFMVPILSLQCDLNHSPAPRFCLRLGLFLLDNSGELQSIGYRFETPEDGDESRHHYYHAQLIRSFPNDSPGWCLNCREWLPDTQPAFALDANGPVTLLLCLLVSLYDLHGVDQILRQVDFRNHLAPYFEAMICHNRQPKLKKKSKSRWTS